MQKIVFSEKALYLISQVLETSPGIRPETREDLIEQAKAHLQQVLEKRDPDMGTKKFGGTRAGMIGTTIGLIVGILAPIPFGIIIGPFIGAFLGELSNKADNKTALKAAFGSFLGFLTGAFMKFVVTMIFLGLFIKVVWEYKEGLFPFLS